MGPIDINNLVESRSPDHSVDGFRQRTYRKFLALGVEYLCSNQNCAQPGATDVGQGRHVQNYSIALVSPDFLIKPGLELFRV